MQRPTEQAPFPGVLNDYRYVGRGSWQVLHADRGERYAESAILDTSVRRRSASERRRRCAARRSSAVECGDRRDVVPGDSDCSRARTSASHSPLVTGGLPRFWATAVSWSAEAVKSAGACGSLTVIIRALETLMPDASSRATAVNW